MCHDILVKEFQNQWDTVGEHQMLGHEFKLVDMIDFEMLEKQKQNGGNAFNDNFLVSIDVDAQFH